MLQIMTIASCCQKKLKTSAFALQIGDFDIPFNYEKFLSFEMQMLTWIWFKLILLVLLFENFKTYIKNIFEQNLRGVSSDSSKIKSSLFSSQLRSQLTWSHTCNSAFWSLEKALRLILKLSIDSQNYTKSFKRNKNVSHLLLQLSVDIANQEYWSLFVTSNHTSSSIKQTPFFVPFKESMNSIFHFIV